MTEPIKKTARKRKSPAEYNAAYMDRYQAKKVTVHFHMTDERERTLHDKLKEYVSSKHVILAALEQYFENND